MSEQTVPTAEPIGALIPSGHCSFPVTADPQSSHERCARNGGGSRANPKKVFTPCPCACHYGEEYECGGCGRPIVECLAWPFDVDGDLHYTHIDSRGWATGEECGTVSRNRTPVAEVDEVAEALADIEAVADEPEDEDDDFIGLDPEPVEPEPEDEWDDLLSEFDLDD